jgi:quercetin dioxygenase-like cupin family protein
MVCLVAGTGGDTRPSAPGSIVFVPAGVQHRFHGIEEELRALVVFGPGVGSPGASITR